MKIALIAPTYLPARRANTIQVMKMAQALVQCGHSVEVLVPDTQTVETRKSTSEQRSWVALAKQYGLEAQFPVRWLPVEPGWRSYDYGWKAVQSARYNQVDLIYTRLPQAAAVSSLLGTPTILEVHNFPQGVAGKALFRFFLRGGGALRLVVITRALADDLASAFGTQVVEPFTLITPDGVDLERFVSLPSPPEARQGLGLIDRFTVGYTGHLYPGRGVELILELASRLPEVTFLLAGGEPAQVARFEELTSQRQISNMILTGFIPNADLPRYQAACEMLLMPYQAQVAASSGGDIGRYLSPMKLFEYLACGRVILASNLPVLQEILNPMNSILLPPEDSNAWLNAIQNGLQFPERTHALAVQAQLDARQYTWTARVEKIFGNAQKPNQQTN